MRRILLLTIMAVFSGTALAQCSNTDSTSLADVAKKKANDDSKHKPKAKHVFTNEDIPERPREGGNGASNGSASTGAASTALSSAADSKADGKEEVKLKNPEAVSTATDKVEKLKKDEQTAAGAVTSLEKMISEGGEFRRNTMGDALQRLKDKLEQVKAQRASAETDLNKLKAN